MKKKKAYHQRKRVNCDRKGKDGELEIVHLIKQYGFNAMRSQQHKGATDSPDILSDLPLPFDIEVKRKQSLNIHCAFQKADDEGAGTPCIFFRRDKTPWLAIVDGQVFMEMMVLIRDAAILLRKRTDYPDEENLPQGKTQFLTTRKPLQERGGFPGELGENERRMLCLENEKRTSKSSHKESSVLVENDSPEDD